MGVRILCTGDVHLGRRPVRIPEGLGARALGPDRAWRRFVDAAIESQLEAVVLTGDAVDQSNRFYEAFSDLQSGVRRLVEAEIPIFAVSGNHDFNVLPRLADQMPGFRLLGRGGRWEEAVLHRQNVPVLRFCGWSFPANHVWKSPLDDYRPPADDLPTVGLLHCDCDAVGSSYGPVSLGKLRAKAPMAWLLGHVHKPGLLCESRPLVLYPGSPQGLDPGEPGAHGAWLVTIEPGRTPTAELRPLAALRWERIDLPLDEVADEDALGPAVVRALRARHDRIRGEMDLATAVGCRLRMLGRTPLHARLPGLEAGIRADLRPVFDGVEYFIEKIEVLSRPDLSLEDLARSNDPAGLLAGRLVLLERREPARAYGELIRKARRPIETSRSGSVFASLDDATGPPTDEQVRSVLIGAGLTMLDRLVSQKETAQKEIGT